MKFFKDFVKFIDFCYIGRFEVYYFMMLKYCFKCEYFFYLGMVVRIQFVVFDNNVNMGCS